MSRKALISILVVAIVLLIDQVVKIVVKTNMFIGQDIHMFGLDWAILHFTENPGMAFGFQFGGGDQGWGKIGLSLFRIVAISAIVYYLRKFIKQGITTGLVICGSMILAGAIGNMIDSAFYGMIFEESPYEMESYHAPDMVQPAQMFPAEGGYAKDKALGGFLQGRVVDMFYFPIIRGHYPKWWPFGGTDHNSCDSPYCDARFIFFRPVFNVADASISIGVILIILFQKRFFKNLKLGEKRKEEEEEEATEQPATESTADDGSSEDSDSATKPAAEN